MSDQQHARQLRQLIEAVALYTDSFEAESVLPTAFKIATNAHEGVQRIDGQPYLNHPLAVAALLAEWHAPVPVVAVGLLHDLLSPEYSRGYVFQEVMRQEVCSALSTDIFRLLEAVVSLNSYMRQVEGEDFAGQFNVDDFWYNMATYLQQDRDAVIVKIADRLHNLQTSDVLTRFYQERMAANGLNLLVPLLGRLSIGAIKRQVEDSCFKINNPIYYSKLQQHCADPQFQYKVEEVLRDLQQIYSTELPGSSVTWRPSSLYSIWQDTRQSKLMHAESLSLDMMDIGIFTILTDKVIDCYTALGLLHLHYLPLEGQVRDMIANRRENGSQGLHTQVKHTSGNLLRVAIRTYTMDEVAEYGIAARWKGVAEDFMPRFSVSRKANQGEIQVFTPKDEMKLLPVGATPIDFAYSIHTSVGNRCGEVLINGERGDLYQPLQTGDRVEIIPAGPDSGPRLEWLQHVKTSHAISGIRHWLSLHRRDDMAERGRALLDRELQPLALDSTDTAVQHLLAKVAAKVAAKEHLKDVEDLFVAIGVGRLHASKIVASLKSMRLKYVEPNVSVQVLSPKDVQCPQVFARCCRPVVDDEIVGYRRNDGVLVIHKCNCPELKGKEQLSKVKWGVPQIEPDCVFVAEALNRPGLAADTSTLMTELGIDMRGFSAFIRPDGVTAEIQIHLGRTIPALRNRVQKALEGASYIINVQVIHNSFRKLPTSGSEPMESSLHSSHSAPFSPSHLPNPYGAGIAEGCRFYGRENERERIFSVLQNNTLSTAVLLWGQRRIGKTSFVLRLRELLSGAFLPVYIDLQGLKDASTTLFLHRLMDRLTQTIKEHVADLPREISVPVLNRLRKDPLTYFDTFMDFIQKITSQYPIVLMLDEFQCLNSLREVEVNRSAIFNRLRSHSQHGRGIRLVLSGGGLLSYLKDQSDITSLFNIARAEKLGCLEPAAARKLIKDGLSKVGTITEPAITLLLNYTSGHPYYLQLLCSRLYDYAQESKAVITSDVASQRIHEWLANADASRFQHLWEGHDTTSAQRNKLVLSALAQLGDMAHPVEYDRLASAIGSTVPEQDLVYALSDLSELGVLEHTHTNYAIKVDIFTRWLRKHWPLDLTLKEVRSL